MNPAQVAEAIVARRRAGDANATINGVEFNLIEKGMCSRFVRQCHQAAGLPTGLFGCCANTTGDNLKQYGKRVQVPRCGDITVFSNNGYTCSICKQPVYHIAVYLGGAMYAENTSSGSRGDPRKAGTKISTFDEIGRDRVWGHFSLQPLAPQPQVLLAPEGTAIDCRLAFENEVARVDLRAVSEALGRVVDARDYPVIKLVKQ
jgi:hypothetical protein